MDVAPFTSGFSRTGVEAEDNRSIFFASLWKTALQGAINYIFQIARFVFCGATAIAIVIKIALR
jgi:hypothetical protein